MSQRLVEKNHNLPVDSTCRFVSFGIITLDCLSYFTDILNTFNDKPTLDETMMFYMMFDHQFSVITLAVIIL